MRRHVYRSADGDSLVRVNVRSTEHGKKVSQQHQDNSRWVSGAGGHRGLLYGRNEIKPPTVWVCEGEKDVERLWAEGKVATTNLGGAGKWTDAMSAELAAIGVERVYLVRDDDQAGEKHAVKVAASLRGEGIKVHHRAPIVGKDVSDHLDAGRPLKDLRRTRPRPTTPEPAFPERVAAPGVLPAALQVLLRVTKATSAGDGQWQGLCPAHDDHSPSLSIARGTDRPVVVTCHAGCTIDAIAAAAGIDVVEFSRLAPTDKYEAEVQEAERRMRVQDEARRRVRAVPRRVPLHDVGQTLVDALAAPQETEEWAVRDLLTRGGNAVLAALMKAGKTTLAHNLSLAWADTKPFLGRFEVLPLEGRVAYLDYELSEAQAMRWWRDLDVQHPERIVRPMFLRGDNLPFWEDDTRDELAAWLRRTKSSG